MLEEGDTGAAVKTLQTRLNVWGATLAVDGDFGPLTLAAVKAFQTAHHLSVDGIVGPHYLGRAEQQPAEPAAGPLPGAGQHRGVTQPQRTPSESSAARLACTDATARNASRR